jgi:hypothetical protein
MVRCKLARERQFQLRAFALQGAEGQGRSHLGIAFTRNKGRQHTPAGDPEEIGDDTAEFEVGILDLTSASLTMPLIVTDCNRNRPGLQSAKIWDQIICIYPSLQDGIICN